MHVLVIGDSGQDVFLYGSCSRLSPEAPVPVLNPIKSVVASGMAGNVARNIESLGIQCDLVTNPVGVVKTRYVDESSNQMILRVDENDTIHRISPETMTTIDFDRYDAVVISDYNKGFLTAGNIEFVALHHPLIFMDSKKEFDSWCDGIEFIKVNKKEFDSNTIYLSSFYSGEVITTLGGKGAMHKGTFYPTQSEHIIRDLSGAGDTFLAAFVVDYITNKDIGKAIQFANKCSSWVVTQRGVVTIDRSKII